jgi:protein-S-isoprenylcysteine O-methyltransferase Ste14
MKPTLLKILHIAGFLFTLYVWRIIQVSVDDRLYLSGIMIVPNLLVFPAVWTAWKIVARNSSPDRLAWTTSILHIVLMIFFGASIIASIRVFLVWSDRLLPLPAGVGIILLVITGIFLALTVLNLAISGLGAPFAIALSKRLANRWMYAYTRNPMVLCTLAVLISAGIYFQSLFYIIWVVLLVTPAFIYFLHAYEERELEARFGTSYLVYKDKTSFLWPRKQKN